MSSIVLSHVIVTVEDVVDSIGPICKGADTKSVPLTGVSYGHESEPVTKLGWVNATEYPCVSKNQPVRVPHAKYRECKLPLHGFYAERSQGLSNLTIQKIVRLSSDGFATRSGGFVAVSHDETNVDAGLGVVVHRFGLS